MSGKPAVKGEQLKSHGSSGLVLEIQRMSTEDGPGLRTTVFLKGCSLACRWCHNPESIASFPEVQWIGSRCIGCQSCLDACAQKALLAGTAGISIDRALCNGCGECSEVCPTGALEKLGAWWSAEALAEELVKDRAYFEKSGGGVTISGGEPTLQSSFVAELCALLKGMGIHTAVDTCGQCGAAALDAALLNCDLVLFDLKTMDSQSHRELTGHGNALILDNLEHVRALSRVAGGELDVWVRTPVIPGDTDSPENVEAIAAFLADRYLGVVKRWELCAFNNLGKDKYMRLGREWPYGETPLLSATTLDELVAVAVAAGIPAGVVLWTGTVARGPGARGGSAIKEGKR